ncbi:hypothetical protein, partial [Herbiconiux daphne]
MGLVHKYSKDITSNNGRRGDVAEHVAAAYLLNRGFEVFANISSNGLFDLLAITPEGEILKFDVKRCSLQAGSKNIVSLHSALHRPDEFKAQGGLLLWLFLTDNFDCVV